MDNCSAQGCTLEEQTESTIHGLKVVAVPHMWLIYLPPNCTSAVQPLDQGIIDCLKARYRKWYMNWLLVCTSLDPSCIDRIARMKPDLREGIIRLAEKWNDLTAELIRHN